MSEQSYFQNALSNFAGEVANGGAIRHLTDLGYTVDQIAKELSFPAPVEQIRPQVWKRLLDTEVILTAEPGSEVREKSEFVREYDQYGKASFRKVTAPQAEQTVIHWKEKELIFENKEKLRSFLEKKVVENKEDRSYAACDFGIWIKEEPKHFQDVLLSLDKVHREYVEGLPWEKKRVYHKLNPRMREILLQLSAKGLLQGDCYFMETGERIRFQCSF